MIKQIITFVSLAATSISAQELLTYPSGGAFLSEVDFPEPQMLDILPCEILIDNYWFDLKPLQNDA